MICFVLVYFGAKVDESLPVADGEFLAQAGADFIEHPMFAMSSKVVSLNVFVTCGRLSAGLE